MMVHLVFAVVLVLTVIGSKKDKFFTLLAFFFLWLFAVLRYMYGNDYYSYFREYIYIYNCGSSNYDGESLFTFLNKICPSFYLLIALTSTAFLFAVYQLLSKNLPKDYVYLGMFIFLINPYLFLMNLSALRQNLALLIFALAVHFSSIRKFIPYALLIFIASLFHQSAWVLLPVYLVAHDGAVRKYEPVCAAAIVIVLLFWTGFPTMVSNLAALFENENYSSYATQKLSNSLRSTLLTGVTFIYVLYNLHKLKGASIKYGKLCLISSGLGVLAYRLSMFTRIQMYFELFSIIAIPQIFIAVQSQGEVIVDSRRPFKSFWDCVNKYVMPLLIVVIYLLRYYSFFTNPMWSSFFHYQTFL